MKSPRILLVFLSIVVPVFFCLYLRHSVFPLISEDPDRTGLRRGTKVHTLSDAEDFARFLDEYGAGLEQILQKKAAPAVYPENLPGNLAGLPVPDKASIFISLVLPNVLRVNKEIRTSRAHMLELFEKADRYQRLSEKEQWWLNRLAWRYGCDAKDRHELLLRVDTVPVALALAQAIDESGWGTSRFALEGNALYGQHLPSSSTGKYILSRQGAVKVAAFDSIYNSTRSYIHSLNSGKAYAELRQTRADLKERGQQVTGYALAAGLVKYSELGHTYVRDLQFLIERYQLELFNAVRLQKTSDKLMVQFGRHFSEEPVAPAR